MSGMKDVNEPTLEQKVDFLIAQVAQLEQLVAGLTRFVYIDNTSTSGIELVGQGGTPKMGRVLGMVCVPGTGLDIRAVVAGDDGKIALVPANAVKPLISFGTKAAQE
jgi:hypothetical protein